MQETFEEDDVITQIMNNIYPQNIDIINKILETMNSYPTPEQSIHVIGSMMGIFNDSSKEVAERLLLAYKEHLLNNYPELKKYKL